MRFELLQDFYDVRRPRERDQLHSYAVHKVLSEEDTYIWPEIYMPGYFL